MANRRRRDEGGTEAPGPGPPDAGSTFPMISPAASQFAEISRVLSAPEPPPEPVTVARGVVVFDLDGTILDDIGLISSLAGEVLETAFGTPRDEARLHYLATTGMPFEAQLAQLYPAAPAELRRATARTFHGRKVREAYAHAHPFPEVPKLLKELARRGWTLAVSTGAEREMADLVLEREGLRYWFEAVLGSAQGTKREHLVEYARRYPGVPLFLVGDSRFDMEAASAVAQARAVARSSRLRDWTLTPADLRRWGAVWADYSLAGLPDALDALAPTGAAPPGSSKAKPARRPPGGRKGRDRESPAAGRVPGRRLNPGRGIHSPPG